MDKWASWLLEKRFGGNEEIYRRTMEAMNAIRDRVLEAAEIKEGDTVLDVGCGDGLLAMRAQELVGDSGKVIFSDISASCLEHCKQFAKPNAGFVQADAVDLSEIASESVDAVVLRSVLIYIQNKDKALSEFFRVLKPGGRLSFFEPINVFSETGKKSDKKELRMLGLDMQPIEAIALKVKGVVEESRKSNGPMMDFDERDLLDKIEKAGFKKIELKYEAMINGDYRQPEFDKILHQSPNPNALTMHEMLDRALSPEERKIFEDYVRPRMHLEAVTVRQAKAFYLAIK